MLTALRATPVTGHPPSGQLDSWDLELASECKGGAPGIRELYSNDQRDLMGPFSGFAPFNQTTISKIQRDPIQSLVPDLFFGKRCRWSVCASSGARRDGLRVP